MLYLVTKKGMSITFDEKDVRPIGRDSSRSYWN